MNKSKPLDFRVVDPYWNVTTLEYCREAVAIRVEESSHGLVDSAVDSATWNVLWDELREVKKPEKRD